MKYFYFIFYSKTKRIRLRLSLFSLIFFSFLFALLLTFSILFVLQRKKLSEEKKMYTELHLEGQENLKTLEEQVKETQEFYEDYYVNLTNYSMDYFKSLNIKNEGQVFNDFKSLFQEAGVSNNSKILEWAQKVHSVKFFLQKLEAFQKVQDKFLSIIPNGWPVKDKMGYITSVYGPRASPVDNKVRMHEGIDIAAPIGTPLIAIADGKVLFSGVKKGYGNVIMIRHEYGYTTLYAHCDRLLKKGGQVIKKGDVIATLGNTGKSTAPHLHLEIRIGRKIINPWVYINSED